MLDRGDIAILHALQQDGRLTAAALAQAAGLSESTCLRRTRALEAAGIIARYTAVIDQQRVGLPLSVFITITLKEQADEALRAFEDAVAAIPEVVECYLMTGSSDYLLRLVARDIDDLERLHATRLTRIAGVARVTSSIAMRQVVKRFDLPIGR